MSGRMPLLIASAAIYMLCMNIPIVVVEQISGLWDVFERALDEYMDLLSNPTYAAINEWAQSYSGKLTFSPATYIFLILVPGPLTLGLSTIWLRVLRGREAYADMVFSGFGNFLRVVALDLFRRIFMILWAILFLVPGVVAYYRYSLAFFLLADNPEMGPFEALSLSKYYMRGNKGNRFALDLSFIGWLVISFIALSLISNWIINIMQSASAETSFFSTQLVSGILSAIVFAPLCAYHGVAAADYYHRVICRDPGSFPELPTKA